MLFNTKNEVNSATYYRNKLSDKVIEDIFSIYGVKSHNRRFVNKVGKNLENQLYKSKSILITKFDYTFTKLLPRKYRKNIKDTILCVEFEYDKPIFKFSRSLSSTLTKMKVEEIIELMEEMK